ncbi:glutamate-rich protein 1-like isoform X2 [Nymphalis io]|uniref:glutamate-rich protein 1-like isoform X2 n=1 Tax=Inachis io TaxID=171585 RepID=UPI002169BADC|nr:glutamate-rich protein 1-like isoform X2 [Nymphalis io]
MSLYYLIFILVLQNQLRFSQQLDKPKTKETVHKAKCKNIKCPPIEDPVCVKIKNEKNNKIAFVVAINKCEIQYAKCRQGFDTVIVPMENCQHDLGNSRKRNSKRNKRETQALAKLADDEKDNSTANLNQDGDGEQANDEGAVEENNEEALEEDNEKAVQEGNDEAVQEDNEESVQEDNEEAAQEDNEEAAQKDNEEAAEEGNEKTVEDNNENGDEKDKVDYEQEDETHQGNSNDKDDKVLNNNDITNDNGDSKYKEESHDNEDRENESERSKDISNLAPDYDQKTQDVDYNQNEKDCPSVCAARAVMVCAKCQHNIYRTFMSPCHIRLFNCKYPDDSLELISRKPCMLSAPFLTNLPEVRGRISEPGDQDPVLKFIHCRDKGKLDDPGCNFDR